ncbi:hypothetical protein ACGFRG_01345 [Streptomyces sp. NPDC048696]|uniref:hypothetical protein n=1 Tax=Streptomyces sp. NPDC048696 TaxID=3365585 RepID=UPI003721EE5A
MTTPTFVTPPPFPPAPPVPPARPRVRRAWLVGAVAALALIAGAAAWCFTRVGDEGPLAGRPRVTDEAAGLSYAVPEGWKRNDGKHLIQAFTSSVTAKSDVVLAGRGPAVEESSLKARTELYARSNTEFFYPDGQATVEESRATMVSGRPAHTVTLRVADSTGRPGRLRMTLIAESDSRSGFLLGITLGAASSSGATDGTDDGRTVDAVLESAEVS